MKKCALFSFIALIFLNNFLLAQSIPVPAHLVIVIDENHAYEQIIGNSGAPYINSLTTDSNTALFTQSYALTHPSQPNYLMLYSGSAQGTIDDNISSTQFTTCNLGASLLVNNISFIGYSEDEPSIGYLGATSGAYARKHNPWSNWQGSSANSIPMSSNVPYSLFPTNFDSLPAVSFVIPNLNDDMHDGTIATGDTWLKNNLNNYITWAKTHNSLFMLTFDEDDDNHNNHITTLFIGQMVKAGSYSNTITHYNVLSTIEAIYGLTDCGSSSSNKPITNCWKSITTGVDKLFYNNEQATIFPNPVLGELTINYETEQPTTVEIFDEIGREIQHQDLPVNSKSATINTSLLPPGFYALRLTSENSRVTRKFFKK
jgi:hypothetical protein